MLRPLALPIALCGTVTLANPSLAQQATVDEKASPPVQSPADSPDDTSDDQSQSNEAQLNLQSFDAVWTAIRDTHWDPTLGGLDWEACRDELRPTPQQAQDIEAVREASNRLMARLKQSHFAIIPKDLYAEDSPTATGTGGWSGIEYRFADQMAIVTRVAAESSAEELGIRPGQQITAIDDRPVVTPDRIAESKGVDLRIAREAAYAMAGKALQGAIGDIKKITVQSVDGETAEHQLQLAQQPGEMVTFGNLPELNLQLETRMIEPQSIGYIRLSIFLDPSKVISRIGDFVSQHPDARGMIVDIRGNPGGIGAMAGGIAGWFADQPQVVMGKMITRSGELKFVAFKRPQAFAGPVALLVDDQSMSTSEIFASGMQLTGRARLFGQTTAGAALPAMIEILPNGDRFLHAFAGIEDLQGQPLEGRGVVPDKIVPIDRKQLTAGQDATFNAAVEWLESQSPAP
jgi:carboxyl-terminal processing protease